MRTSRIICLFNMLSAIVIGHADLATAQGTTASLDAKTQAIIAETALLNVEAAIRERASKPEVVAKIQRMMMTQGMADNLLQDKMQQSVKPLIMEKIRPTIKGRIVDKVTPPSEEGPTGM